MNKYSSLSQKQMLEICEIINPDTKWSFSQFFKLKKHTIMGTAEFLGEDESCIQFNVNESKDDEIRCYLKGNWDDDFVPENKINAINLYLQQNSPSEYLKNELNENQSKKDAHASFVSNKLNSIEELDKNQDGIVDLIDNDFNKLLMKQQKVILNFDKNFVHQFVKISNYIKTKQVNTQKIFESIRDTSSQDELEERLHLLKNQIHSYELLIFHSINMITALVSEDLITFYEIYESFDKLSIFNSNWENEVAEKLTNIGDKLDDLMHSIYNMERNIVNELSHLSYVTQSSFEELNISVKNQLNEIESSINTNNLLTGIQAYQLYKINQNTKSLRG